MQLTTVILTTLRTSAPPRRRLACIHAESRQLPGFANQRRGMADYGRRLGSITGTLPRNRFVQITKTPQSARSVNSAGRCMART